MSCRSGGWKPVTAEGRCWDGHSWRVLLPSLGKGGSRQGSRESWWNTWVRRGEKRGNKFFLLCQAYTAPWNLAFTPVSSSNFIYPHLPLFPSSKKLKSPLTPSSPTHIPLCSIFTIAQAVPMQHLASPFTTTQWPFLPTGPDVVSLVYITGKDPREFRWLFQPCSWWGVFSHPAQPFEALLCISTHHGTSRSA